MKFALFAVAPLFAFAAASALPADDAGLEARQFGNNNNRCGSRRNASPFYRSYNAQVVDHFYTTNSQEVANAVPLGYAREGTAGYLFNNRERGTVPFYRLYSASGTDHFYTSSSSERSQAEQNGYKLEATYYIFPNRDCGGVPLYRLYSAQGVDHFYTTSSQERDQAQRGGYQSEGIAGYVFGN